MIGRWYNIVWRWHFYAGLFCLPFVVWLACTGSLYLWRPQIEAWLDRGYDSRSIDGAVASADVQVDAALKAVPGSQLRKYQMPHAPTDAARIIVTKAGVDTRVFVDTHSLAVLGAEVEEQRPFRVLFHLHGELLAGAVGSYVVETAACWTIVMLITGLYLWWPRGRRGFGGILYPRLWVSGRTFWRDLHATTGFWASLFALGLILTGLPWAKGWGTYLSEIRQLTGTSSGPVDWSIGGKMPIEHSDHHMGHAMTSGPPIHPGELDRVIAVVRPLEIAAPVLISPPKTEGGFWSVASDAANRSLRSDLKIDGVTGQIRDRKNFADRHWIDRAIGYGVAAHEGALFGFANQIIGTLTALFLVVLSCSGAVMWWRRRPSGKLGAPPSIDDARPRFGTALMAFIAVLALYMPMFGVTLLFVLLFEFAVLRRAKGFGQWLGLAAVGS